MDDLDQALYEWFLNLPPDEQIAASFITAALKALVSTKRQNQLLAAMVVIWPTFPTSELLQALDERKEKS